VQGRFDHSAREGRKHRPLEEHRQSVREWTTRVECRRGPWSDESVDFDEVGKLTIYR
jgi:hypothetical protein